MTTKNETCPKSKCGHHLVRTPTNGNLNTCERCGATVYTGDRSPPCDLLGTAPAFRLFCPDEARS